MMADMPRPRPPHLHLQRTQHGKLVWYVRKGKGPRTRLRAEFGTDAFEAEYHAAVNGDAPTKTGAKAATGSVSWLWTRFRETAAWTSLKGSTRRQRENIMARVIANVGDVPAGDLTPADILAGRDARAATPSQAKGFLVCMRAMYRWAVAAGIPGIKEDPTIGVKAFPKKKGAGFKVWTEDEVDRYQARWPIGTKERVWIDVLLYTGLRRGDVVTIGRQHVRNGIATLRTEKGQGVVIVTLPILPILAITLAAGPCADLAFVCGSKGKPLTKESFGNAFKEACVKAGVSEDFKAAHGIRKAGAVRAADNGATEKQLNAIFGWTGSDMARLYTEAADRKRASIRGMETLARPGEGSA